MGTKTAAVKGDTDKKGTDKMEAGKVSVAAIENETKSLLNSKVEQYYLDKSGKQL